MSWTAVRPMSPVDHHNLMSCVVHIPGGVGVVVVGVVAAIVGVGAAVARRDVVPAIVTVVVRVVVVRTDGGCCGRHCLCFCRCIYSEFFDGGIRLSDRLLNVEMMEVWSWENAELTFGLRRISWAF